MPTSTPPSAVKDVAVLLLRYAEPARKPSRHVMRCSTTSVQHGIISGQQSSQPSALLLLAKHNDEKLVQVPRSRISTTARFAISFRLHLPMLGDVPIPAAE